MISIKRLDKTFNRGKQNAIHVVNDVSLELPESGMVAIFGRSGCGKTTLLNVIGGLDRVESGSVEIDREKMSVSNDALRNRSIGYIFQNY
ncbi:MAG: ATP-binding cassette domain-containing protein, partial [Clostridia bacterium]|nr:ATP-binding cassette domain-containing protein [Clostridia bacterium]